MKKTNKITIGIIIIGILLLGIGYAAIQNITLYIRGTVTADPSQANFKVRFTQIKSKSETTTSQVLAEIVDDLNATINVTGLTEVDETVFATYEIKNESESLSADLAIATTNNNEEYFEITSELEKKSLIAGETTTVTVTVTLIKAPLIESESTTVDVEITAVPVQPGEEGTFGEENTPQDTFAQMVKENPTMYYGKYVDYPIDIDLESDETDNDWKVFYSDGKNVFLITDDYVPNEKVPTTSLDMSKAGNYGIYWNTIPSSKYSINDSNYMISRASTFLNSNDNYKIVSTLLATNEWESFVDGTLADSAIGAPTIEMWTASWNNLYEDKLYCNNANETGYYIGNSSNPTTTEIYISNFEGYNNSLYFPYKKAIDFIEEHYWAEEGEYGAYGYLLACPTAYDSYCLMMVNARGKIDYNMHFYSQALRPVVCLNENVAATLNGEVLELSK